MKRINYPARRNVDFTTLCDEYKNIYAVELPRMEREWADWKVRNAINNIPETVEELLVADVDVLADVYERFTSQIHYTDGHRHRNIELVYLDEHIFQYTGLYDEQIAQFFVNKSEMLHISSCYYCETAYINVYATPQRRQFDVDHFLPKKRCPIVALSLFNFVPSCQVCNSRIKLSKPVGSNRVEWEKFNPAGERYSFDSNVQIRLRMHHGYRHNLTNSNAYYIYFRSRNGFRSAVDFFHLEERYEFHKNEALRIKKLRAEYPKSARIKIARILGKTEAEIREDLFHKRYMNNNHRCFAKLTEDMLK